MVGSGMTEPSPGSAFVAPHLIPSARKTLKGTPTNQNATFHNHPTKMAQNEHTPKMAQNENAPKMARNENTPKMRRNAPPKRDQSNQALIDQLADGISSKLKTSNTQ